MYVKIIGNNCGNYPYRIGLNTLKHNNEVFDPEETCGPGGLYYTTPQYIFEYNMYGDKVCILTIPNEAKVVTFDDKCKSDRFIIEKIIPLWTLETIQYLVSLGADIHVDYNCVLRWAAQNDNIETIKYLVSIGADIHADDNVAILWASMYGYLEVVQYFVSMGADIHSEDGYAIRLASDYGHLEVVKYLVSVGANIYALNDQALRWASDRGHLDVVEYIQGLNKN